MTSSVCPRAATYVDQSGTVGTPTSTGTAVFSGNNARAAVTINAVGDYAIAGSTGAPYVGYAPVGGGTATTLVSGTPNPRCVAVYNNTLFFTTASAPAGIYMLGTPGVISTASAQPSTLVTATGAYPNSSPSSFVFQSSTVLWVCDDGAAASYGVWKLSGTLGVAASYNGEHEALSSSHRVIVT